MVKPEYLIEISAIAVDAGCRGRRMKLGTSPHRRPRARGLHHRGPVVATHGVLLPDSLGDVVHIIEGGAPALSQVRAHPAGCEGADFLLHDARPAGTHPPLPPRRAVHRLELLGPLLRERGQARRAGRAQAGGAHLLHQAPGVTIGPMDDIAYDAGVSPKWDYEAEIVVVFGKNRAQHSARQGDGPTSSAIAWPNDVSQRDLQRRTVRNGSRARASTSRCRWGPGSRSGMTSTLPA